MKVGEDPGMLDIYKVLLPPLEQLSNAPVVPIDRKA